MCLEKCWKNNLNYYKSNPYSFIFPNFRINLSSKVPDKGVPSFLGFTITLGVSVIDRFAEKLPSWGSLVENRPGTVILVPKQQMRGHVAKVKC